LGHELSQQSPEMAAAAEQTAEWARLAGRGWEMAARISAGGPSAAPAQGAAPAPAPAPAPTPAPAPAPALKKGFLAAAGAKVPPSVTGDVGEFLNTTAREIMVRAGELMAQEGPETAPFKFKYEARELLVCARARAQPQRPTDGARRNETRARMRACGCASACICVYLRSSVCCVCVYCGRLSARRPWQVTLLAQAHSCEQRELSADMQKMLAGTPAHAHSCARACLPARNSACARLASGWESAWSRAGGRCVHSS